MEFKSKIVDSAVASYYPPRRIINEALTIVSKEDGAAVPSYTSSQRTIERKRRKKYLPLPRPKSFGEIMIPDELKKTNGGGRFLLYDNESSSHRIIILSSDDDLDRLSNSEHWHSDGTFKIAPQLFEQLYVIHGYIYGRALPLVYYMVAGTAEVLYNEVFDVILQNVSGRPKTITIDFEKAVENSLGLQQSFVDDSQVRRCLKNFGCLAFVPVPFVIVEFEKIQESAPDLVNNFVDYFEDTFIGR
ncbi:unnamed protein product, partial [Rotaria magnacalcarata]